RPRTAHRGGIGAEYSQTICLGNAFQVKPAQLDQVAQLTVMAAHTECPPGAVVVKKDEPERLALHHKYIVGSEIAVDESGPVQTADLGPQAAQEQAPARRSGAAHLCDQVGQR